MKITWNKFPLFRKLYHQTIKTSTEKIEKEGLMVRDNTIFLKDRLFEAKYTYVTLVTLIILGVLIIIKSIFFR